MEVFQIGMDICFKKCAVPTKNRLDLISSVVQAATTGLQKVIFYSEGYYFVEIDWVAESVWLFIPTEHTQRKATPKRLLNHASQHRACGHITSADKTGKVTPQRRQKGLASKGVHKCKRISNEDSSPIHKG